MQIRCALRVMLLVLLFAQVAAVTPVFAQGDPASGSAGCAIGPLCGIGDLSAWLQQTLQEVLTQFVSGLVLTFGLAALTFVNHVNFLTRTPAILSYNQELVHQFGGTLQVLADALLAVVLLVAGYNVMLRPHLGAAHTSAGEMLPRLLWGTVLVNTARGGVDSPSTQTTAPARFSAPRRWATSSRVCWMLLVARSTALIVVLIVVIVTLLLIVQQLMRLALVDALVILAPLAAALWILPQTRGWGQLWARLFVGTVFAQCVQVLTLRIGFNLATGLPPLTAAGVLQTAARHRGVGARAEGSRTYGWRTGWGKRRLGCARHGGRRVGGHGCGGWSPRGNGSRRACGDSTRRPVGSTTGRGFRQRHTVTAALVNR